MELIMEFDLEDLWRHQNLNDRLYKHFYGRSNIHCTDRAQVLTWEWVLK